MKTGAPERPGGFAIYESKEIFSFAELPRARKTPVIHVQDEHGCVAFRRSLSGLLKELENAQ